MSILSYKKIQGKKTKEYRYYRIYQSILKIKYHITICWRCDCSIVSIKIAFRGADMKRQVIIKNCEKQGAGYTALRNPVFHKRNHPNRQAGVCPPNKTGLWILFISRLFFPEPVSVLTVFHIPVELPLFSSKALQKNFLFALLIIATALFLAAL